MHAQQKRRRRTIATFAVAAIATPLIVATTASPATAAHDPAHEGKKLAEQLVKKTDGKGSYRHMKVFQAIAKTNENNRAAGARGHELSAKYAGTLLKAAGYKVTYQEFDFIYRDTVEEKLTVLSPEERDINIKLMTYTKSTPEGGTKAPVAEVPVDDSDEGLTGCAAEDYDDFEGKIALIQRGGCSFSEKQAAAGEAGAIGAIIYNNEEGELNGTLEDVDNGVIPTGGISKEDGEALSTEIAEGEVEVNLEIIEFQEERKTPNVIAETRGGDEDNTVVVGAHLDSVTEGPGINDNASGSAGVLQTALQYAKATGQTHGWKGKGPKSPKTPKNKVRFALWTAEELGLQGAQHYVDDLSKKQREQIALYLNFDMIASPNYGLFVYDGDDSDGEGEGPGPEGSAQIEYKLNEFFASKGEESRGTDFSGRSDYGPFIEVGIPSGGTFTGAEGEKTEEQAKLWGGKAGVAYDECYHLECDDLKNVDKKALDINVKAIAHAVGHYAWDTSTLEDEVPFEPTSGGTPSGGGLHEHHHHDEPVSS